MAIVVQKAGGGGIGFFIFIIVAIIIFIFLARNPNFKNWLNSLMGGGGGGGQQQAPQQQQPLGGEEQQPAAPSGEISTELTCPSGETCVQDDQGRYDCDESKGDSYESTWCGSFSGDDLTIKLYGPPHSNDGDCCWCVLYIKPDSGQFVGGGEGPHPSSNCEDKGDGESIGSTSDICVKVVIQPGPHVTGYAVVDGAWKQMIDYTADCGCDETSSEKTGDQVTFRCDGDFNTTCATVRQLGSGGGGGGGGETTPAPAGEEEEEEEEEEANLARRAMSAKAYLHNRMFAATAAAFDTSKPLIYNHRRRIVGNLI